MIRFGRRLLFVLALAMVAVAGWAVPAFAHAQLQSTTPASGAVLAKSPGTVVLHFSEDVEVQFGAVRVFDSHSKRIDDGNSYHPGGDGHAVAVKVPASLAAGGYVVTWRVISADSHPVHGAFTFLVGSGGANAATAARSQAARLLATTGGSATVGVVFGMIRFAGFAALFVLVGGAAFVAGGWPEGRDDVRAAWLLRAGLIGAIVTTVGAIALQGPYGGGLPLLKALSPTVFREVLTTRFGEVYLARLVILVAAGAPLLMRLLRSAPLPRWWRIAGIATGAALLVTPGLAGHAATGSLIALAIPFDLVHVSAAAIWVGGLSVLAVAVLIPVPGRAGPSPMRMVLPRYSQWALGAVLAIAVSGGFAAWRQVGSLSAATTTPFGRLVLAKTVVFVILVAVATKSRRIVHGGLALPFGLSRARRPPGAAGATAAAGAVGAAGATGATGATGAAGAVKAAGAAGATGATGATGAAGAVKAAGATGTIGTIGTSEATAAAAAPASEVAPARRLSPGPGAMAAPPTNPKGRAPWGAPAARPVRRRSGAQRQSDLRRAVGVELLLLAVVIALTTMLVNAQPAREALSVPFSTEVHAGPNVLVDVVVDPAKAGPVAIHLYALSADGAQLDVPEVDATMSLPSAGITNLTVPLEKGGTGHFLVGGFDVPLKGTWTMNITVRTTEFDESYATPVTIRMR